MLCGSDPAEDLVISHVSQEQALISTHGAYGHDVTWFDGAAVKILWVARMARRCPEDYTSVAQAEASRNPVTVWNISVIPLSIPGHGEFVRAGHAGAYLESGKRWRCPVRDGPVGGAFRVIIHATGHWCRRRPYHAEPWPSSPRARQLLTARGQGRTERRLVHIGFIVWE